MSDAAPQAVYKMSRMSPRCIPCAFALILSSCAPPAYQEQGWASYVAESYAGRPTSSGEIYNPGGYTAAHHTLPFGTQVKVKNTYTGRSVNVVINDRFPHYPGRVINLSSAAAQYIGIPYLQMGVVKVTAKTLGGYGQQQPGYGYAQQPAYTQPTQTFQPQPAYSAPKPTYQFQPPASSGAAPSAPAFNGGASPPGLKTF